MRFDHAAASGRLAGRIWSDVNLTVAPGEFVAVLGPNGVGKSTLIKAALGLRRPGGGTRHGARPPGRPVRQGDRLPAAAAQLRRRPAGARRRRRPPGLDGERWGVPLPWATGCCRSPARARDRVREVIELVGATAYASRPIGELSGGEQQRLLIAQALVRRPALLLLDEPLDSLDLPNQASVAALVCQDLPRAEGDRDAGRPRRQPDPALPRPRGLPRRGRRGLRAARAR